MSHLDVARNVFSIEREALEAVAGRLDDRFERACDAMLSARGRVVVLGMGKSGIIGRKISATLSSTGTPSLFLHPGDAFHGDLGALMAGDVALMISKSGETEELVRIVPFLQEREIPIVAITEHDGSALARQAQVVLDVTIPREACSINLAPTASATVALVMGDALAVALATCRNFQAEDFARFHPGGYIGRRLLLRVTDVMRPSPVPSVEAGVNLKAVLRAISAGGFGLVLVLAEGVLRGIITDGDVRRSLERAEDPMLLRAADMMTPDPKVARPGERFAEAERRMLGHKINSLVVVSDEGEVVGVVQIYDGRGASLVFP
jgi:arabinose-5-phosphate isomerase